MKGLFITFEGPEGAGKTTIVEALKRYTEANGISCIYTREPGGISISEQIRDIILKEENTLMDGKTEALLFAASRRQHLVEKVIPALKSGKIVVCDRFIDSSLVYQGYARNLTMESVMRVNSFAIGEYMPDITIYLDIDPELGLSRISKNTGREINRLDLETLDFHKKVREGYKLLIKEFPDRIIEIDASKDMEEVFEAVLTALRGSFKEFGLSL
ncbi:dTMP kinase [Alloiococcus sp. CFN-8]|uniref:dTMP kinase n=1 Tax=Alloiococcus sp. CFN-8 TaxID=3416081 RepID=UPI003CE67DEB